MGTAGSDPSDQCAEQHITFNIEIRGIIVKNTPFYKKPPLVSPRSETRGGFLKKVTSRFADFEDFPLENRSKNSVFVKENLFRRLPNHKKNRLRRAVN